MPDRVLPGPVTGGSCVQEAVCVHTNKIYDSCKDKDCINNLRLYPTVDSQQLIDTATSLKAKCAELLAVDVSVERAPFTNGCYTISLRYYYKIIADAYVCGARTGEIEGLAIFDKRVILYGSTGGAKVFSSYASSLNVRAGAGEGLPEAIVEALDPIVLDIGLIDMHHCYPPAPPAPPGPPMPPRPPRPECDESSIPDNILDAFDSALFMGDSQRRVLVTLGQFSIVRLERDTHLLIPVYDNCLPEKECTGGEDGSNAAPCDLFSQVEFPVESFFPPMGSGSCTDFKPTAGTTCD